MNQIILTGATGFIGSHFVKYLTDKGCDVLAIGRKNFDEINHIRQKKLAKATYLKLSMVDIEELPNEIEKINYDVLSSAVFVNLAWGGVDGLSDLNICEQLNNVTWSVSAMQAANRIGCKRFVHIGTMEEAFTNKYLELDHNTSSEYNRHVIYSVAKIAAKNALKMKAMEIGMDFIHVLHSHVMGPGDDKDSFLQVTLSKLVNREELVFSSGEQLFDVVSLYDCCNGYFLICSKGIGGCQYWVGSGEPRKLRDYVEKMYVMYPSPVKLEFGKLSYNDIKLQPSDFSIDLLTLHTGYAPRDSYEDAVRDLHNSLYNSSFLQ